MNATPKVAAAQIVTARAQRAQRPVYSTSTGDAPRVEVKRTPSWDVGFVGPCGCRGCEKWADCYYCDGCRAVD